MPSLTLSDAWQRLLARSCLACAFPRDLARAALMNFLWLLPIHYRYNPGCMDEQAPNRSVYLRVLLLKPMPTS